MTGRPLGGRAAGSAAGPDPVGWLRTAAPYINAHRGQTCVIYLGDRAAAGPTFAAILQDVALLATVGVQVVLVYGTRSLVDAALGRPSGGADAPGATDPAAMRVAIDVAGRLRFRIEACLSMALANVPLVRSPLRVTSGNFVRARPAGVREGQDLMLTGELRRIDAAGIRQSLDQGQVVLVPPIGYSPGGELFSLDGGELAARIAVELRAAKLIAIERDLVLRDAGGGPVRELTLQAARELLAGRRAGTGATAQDAADAHLAHLCGACGLGVQRGHLLDAGVDGALILELFTRDGVGTLVAADVYDETRHATSADVPGIVELIAPLERSGALVPRPRERLEREIDRFLVMERDGTIVACAAVHPLPPGRSPGADRPDFAELACLAVHPAYRNGDRGDALLRRAEQEARTLGARHLLVLTTQAEHWFRERGFVPHPSESLPETRRRTYDLQRNSKVLVKALEG